jgi:hypothetical protein
MPQKFLKFFNHAAHCGRRPRVFYDKQFCVGITAFLAFKNFQPKGQATGGRTPFSFHLILRAIPCCSLNFPTPAQRAFYFFKVF